MPALTAPVLSAPELARFLEAREADPHHLLGMHRLRWRGKDVLVVRALLRDTVACEVVAVGDGEGGEGADGAVGRGGGRRSWPLRRLDEAGFFEGVIAERGEPFRYQLRATRGNREVRQFFDPYAFPEVLGEDELYRINEGTEHRVFEKLGARVVTVAGVAGVAFAVWAPNASRVSVVGGFNQWDGRYHPMRSRGRSGVWELFIPGLEPGTMYKYEILGHGGLLKVKADPCAAFCEGPPGNASIVVGGTPFAWGDGEWMARRAAAAGTPDRPVSVYELHPGSWRRVVAEGGRPLTWRELAPALADHVADLGFTHVELMGVAEHPFDGSWGYQVTGFYAPTHRFGTPDDFRWFVDHLHRRGVGVILDWVPAHFPRDAFALEHFDGTCLYEHEDPRQGAHQDWGTLIFNYGRAEVRGFLTGSALAWCERFHIDGLRVDAVASMLYLDYSRREGEWVPNRHGGRENLDAIDFLRETNRLVHQYHPGVLMVAEESTAFAGVTKPVEEGGLGFDLKWNMGWMHDTLRFFTRDPVHRKWHYHDLSFGMLYQYSERFLTSFSHDEVVHGKGSMLMKMPAYPIAEKARHLRSLYAYQWLWPGKKLLFMGGEFGQSAEWDFAGQLDWSLRQYTDHEGLLRLVRDLNRWHAGEPVLGRTDFDPAAFRWISCWDEDASVIAWLRGDPDRGDAFLVVGHFTPVVRERYRIGVPRPGLWREVLNTESSLYGGHDIGNAGAAEARPVEADRLPWSLELTLPPCAVLLFRAPPGA